MLDALGVGFGGFSRNADGAQHLDHQSMAGAHPMGPRPQRVFFSLPPSLR